MCAAIGVARCLCNTRMCSNRSTGFLLLPSHHPALLQGEGRAQGGQIRTCWLLEMAAGQQGKVCVCVCVCVCARRAQPACCCNIGMLSSAVLGFVCVEALRGGTGSQRRPRPAGFACKKGAFCECMHIKNEQGRARGAAPSCLSSTAIVFLPHLCCPMEGLASGDPRGCSEMWWCCTGMALPHTQRSVGITCPHCPPSAIETSSFLQHSGAAEQCVCWEME